MGMHQFQMIVESPQRTHQILEMAKTKYHIHVHDYWKVAIKIIGTIHGSVLELFFGETCFHSHSKTFMGALL
jgi:hypothetical protein